MDANGYNEARNIRQSTLEGQVEVRMATFGWTMQQFTSGGGKWAPEPKFASYSHLKLPIDADGYNEALNSR